MSVRLKYMNPIVKRLPEKKLIGKRISMSYANNTTHELWKSFMPHRKDITNRLNSDLFSIQVFDESFDFTNFNPNAIFEKWAAVEVDDIKAAPIGMGPYTLPGGLYAVFLYVGAASEGAEAFQYIFIDWLPKSDYILDNRPHFEVLGEKYKNEDPRSEEEIWIPIKPKIIQ